MTKRGIFSLVFEFFLLIMALGTDIREFLIVAVCVGGLLLYSLLSVMISLIAISFKSETDEKDLVREDWVEYTLSVSGVVILPVVAKLILKTADNGDITGKEDRKHSILLYPDFKYVRTFMFKMPCQHTGIWDVGIEKFRLCDLFGMISVPLIRTTKEEHTSAITVWPKTHLLDEDNSLVKVTKHQAEFYWQDILRVYRGMGYKPQKGETISELSARVCSELIYRNDAVITKAGHIIEAMHYGNVTPSINDVETLAQACEMLDMEARWKMKNVAYFMKRKVFLPIICHKVKKYD